MHTTMGDIVIELDQAAAPITCANFLRYADRGFFDGTIIHRVVPGFVIQGGGLTQDMSEKPTDLPIKNEWRNGLSNVRGAVAMARVGGEADSATSQFFINLVDNAMLDEARDGAAYAVFGAVISGMEIVDQIAAVQTETRGEHAGVPVEPIIVESVVRMPNE
ncbi:MAG: peptidylprolyl isomerase [Phycisphaerales bacterium]|nr:peptidylprolyl isomerase [Phycisphaerales bacterium]